MRSLLVVFLLLVSAPAFAGISPPPEIARVIHATTPYGWGSCRWMWVKAYDAALWTDASSWSMKSPFALTLYYRMHFTSKALVNRSIKEMHHIAPLSATETENLTARLTPLFPNVNDGDIITALYIPLKGITIFYNGKPTGSITDDAIAKRFLDIWLSEKTSAPALRKQLLGG